MNITEQTLAEIKKSQANPLDSTALQKAGWTQATGLVYYDLQAPAKLLFPFVTPLRNRIPRVKGRGDTATRWKTITSLNSGNVTPGVSEGNRGALLSTTVNDITAAYKSMGLEDSVTFEADLAAEGFDDARARAAQGLLVSMMNEEERLMLGGNVTTGLGTPATPTSSTPTVTSTLTNQTYSIIVVALTLDGYRQATVAGGLTNTYAQTSAGPYSNTDTHNGGISKKSAAKTQSVAGTTVGLTMSTTPILGAVAYAWFWGLGGSELLGAITTSATYTALAEPTGTQNASAISSATDRSKDTLVYDGILGIVASNSTSAYNVALANGGKLSSDGAIGIVEINTALKSFWDNYRTGPDIIWVSSQELLDISSLIFKNGGASLARFLFDAGADTNRGNALIGQYLNPFTQMLINIQVHPFLPQGTIVFDTKTLPAQFFQYSNVGSPIELHYRRDYYQLDWPLVKRAYEFGVYNDAVLACYAPFTFGLIQNISKQ